MNTKARGVSIFAGVRYLAAGTLAVNIGRLALLLALSRLLPATAFGVLSLATAVVSFSSFFVDAGVSNVFYQAELKDDKARSSLFWLNVLLGFCLATVLVLFSPVLARFYAIPDFHFVLSFAALGLVFTAVAAQHRVLLRRMMRFDLLVKIESIAFVVNAVVTLIGVIWGYGVYAMVAGTLLNNLVAEIGYLWAGGKQLLPGWVFSPAAVRPFLAFGLYQMGERLSNFLAERSDVFIIGKVLGPGPLGLYDVMKQLLSRPESLINPVIAQATLPMMAKKSSNMLFVRKIYFKGLETSNTLNMAVMGLVFCAAEPFLAIVTGPQWAGEADTFRWLAAYFIVHASFNPVGALLLAKGRADLGFWWNLAMLLLVPAFVWAGASGGIRGIAALLFLLFAGLIIPVYYVMIRPLTDASLTDYARTFFRPLAMASISGLVAWPFAQASFLSPFQALAAAAFIFSSVAFMWLKKYQKDTLRLIRRIVLKR